METNGFTMSLAHDFNLLTAVDVRQGPPIEALNGGSGPDFFAPLFHGDGICVGVLYDFARQMMFPEIELRFRSSFFPFTEPSAEIDFECLLCAGEGCATCAQTGWLEWGGCGMIHPQVLRSCEIDPARYQGYAFGMGLERVAMLRHGLPQIRLLYDGDLRVLDQL